MTLLPRLFLMALTAAVLLPGFLASDVSTSVALASEDARPLTQQDADKMRQEIMEMVQKRMQKQRAELMKDIDKVLASSARKDDELARARDRIRALERQVAELKAALDRQRAGDAPETASDQPAPAIMGFAFRPADKGIEVTYVLGGTPAAKAGLKEGDVITKVDGAAASQDSFLSRMREKKPGDRISIAFQRSVDGQTRVMEAKTRVVSRADFDSAIQSLNDEPAAAEPARPVPTEPAVSEPVRMGIMVREENFVLTLTEIEPGSNAAEAGLKPNDVLLAMAGRKVTTLDSLKEVLGQLRVGGETTIKVRRATTDIVSTLVLGGGNRKPVLKGIQEFGREAPKAPTDPAKPRRPGFLGIRINTEKDGVFIDGVEPGTSAAQMGIQAGDQIVGMNDREIGGLDDLRKVLGSMAAGDSIRIKVKRGDRTMVLEGKLGGRPGADQAQVEVTPTDAAKPAVRPPGSLGIVAVQTGEVVKVDGFVAGGAAEKAGLEVGDVIAEADGRKVKDFDSLRGVLAGKNSGDELLLKVVRNGRAQDVRLKLVELAASGDTPAAELAAKAPAAPARAAEAPANSAPAAPAKPVAGRPVLGVTLEELIDEGRIVVRAVEPGGPAASAGLKSGDQILDVSGQKVESLERIRTLLMARRPGEELTFRVRRAKEELEVKVTLGTN